MPVLQVSVRFHRQRSSVLVTQELRDGWNIHTTFNTPGSKQVPQIVMRESLNIEFGARPVNRFLALCNRQDKILFSAILCPADLVLSTFQISLPCRKPRTYYRPELR